VVEHLLDKGGDIEALTKDGMTPLLLAAQHGADNTATLLIERGSDPNGRTSDGLTVLHKAVGNARTLQTITKVWRCLPTLQESLFICSEYSNFVT
jgi:ankyrin repeat protein